MTISRASTSPAIHSPVLLGDRASRRVTPTICSRIRSLTASPLSFRNRCTRLINLAGQPLRAQLGRHTRVDRRDVPAALPGPRVARRRALIDDVVRDQAGDRFHRRRSRAGPPVLKSAQLSLKVRRPRRLALGVSLPELWPSAGSSAFASSVTNESRRRQPFDRLTLSSAREQRHQSAHELIDTLAVRGSTQTMRARAGVLIPAAVRARRGPSVASWRTSSIARSSSGVGAHQRLAART